jgi:hypothetical protein
VFRRRESLVGSIRRSASRTHGVLVVIKLESTKTTVDMLVVDHIDSAD